MRTLICASPSHRLYRVRSARDETVVLREHFPPSSLRGERLRTCLTRGLVLAERLRRAPHPGYARVLEASAETTFTLVCEEVEGATLETALAWRREKTPEGAALDWVDDLLTVLLHLRHRVGLPCRQALEFDQMVLTPDGRLVLVDPGWEALLWAEDDPVGESETEFLDAFYRWVDRLRERLDPRGAAELAPLLQASYSTAPALAHALRARRLELLEPFEIPQQAPVTRVVYRPQPWKLALTAAVLALVGWLGTRHDQVFILREPAVVSLAQRTVFLRAADDGRELGRWPLPVRGAALAVHPSGNWLYVSLPETARIAVLNSRTGEVVSTISSDGAPGMLAFGSETVLFCLPQEGPWLSVYAVDSDTGAAVLTKLLPAAPRAEFLAAAGGRAAVSAPASQQVFWSDGERVVSVYVPSPGPVALSGDGLTMYLMEPVLSRLTLREAVTGQILREVPCPGFEQPVGLVRCPDGSLVALDASGTLARFAPDGALLARSVLGSEPQSACTLSGDRLWVSQRGDEGTLVVRLDDLRVTDVLPGQRAGQMVFYDWGGGLR